MGIFSEVNAEYNAKNYEEILLEAIKEYENGEFKLDVHNVIMFCKKHIYPRYCCEIGDTFRTVKTENEEKIDNFFKKY